MYLFRLILLSVTLGLLPLQLTAQMVGHLNMQFGNNGVSQLPPSSEAGLVLKAMAGGGYMTAQTLPASTGTRAEIRRFGEDGIPDPTFGENGIRVIFLEGAVQDMVVKEDSSLYVCGFVQRGRNRDVWVMHLLSNGKTDPDFGTQGVVTHAIFDQDNAQQIALDAQGRLLVSGTSYSPGSLERDLFVIRLQPNGHLDLGFGNRGTLLVDISKDDRLKAMAVRADNRIILAGNTRPHQLSRFTVVRLTPNGSLDPAFGTDGYVVLPVGIEQSYLEAMTLMEDGRILVGGNVKMNEEDPGFDLAVVRLLQEGQWDKSFGSSGVSVHDLGGAEYFGGIALQEDQQILIGGISGRSAQVFRLKESGAHDPTYGKEGYASINCNGRVRSFSMQLDATENLLLSLAEDEETRVFLLNGNPHLPGIDEVLSFDWEAGDHPNLTYAGIDLDANLRMDAWLGGPLIPEDALRSGSGPKHTQPVQTHIRFYAHLSMDEQHRYTFIWDSEGQAHWYRNGRFQSSWSTLLLPGIAGKD